MASTKNATRSTTAMSTIQRTALKNPAMTLPTVVPVGSEFAVSVVLSEVFAAGIPAVSTFFSFVTHLFTPRLISPASKSSSRL